jgi:hypothetical protein
MYFLDPRYISIHLCLPVQSECSEQFPVVLSTLHKVVLIVVGESVKPNLLLRGSQSLISFDSLQI